MELVAKDGSSVVQFRNRILRAIEAHVATNAVTTVRLTFAINRGHSSVFEIAGVNAIQLERDAAGFPTRLELSCEDEKTVLLFTGTPQSAPTYSRNSWGE